MLGDCEIRANEPQLSHLKRDGKSDKPYRIAECCLIGAFKFGDVVLNRMHVREDLIARTDGGGLTLTDSASTLTLRADIPKYREDIRDQVNRRILRGFSVEMRVTAEDWPSPDRRIVKAAELLGIGLVDRAAYGEATAQLAKRAADGGLVEVRWWPLVV